VKAFVITLTGHPYSEAKASRCIETARDIGGIAVKRFTAVDGASAIASMTEHGLRWTWANGNTSEDVCKLTGLSQRPYGKLLPKIGCAMSHFVLWAWCVHEAETCMILEHDAVFERRFDEFGFRGICQINDPLNATPRGKWWSDNMRRRGPGVFDKTHVFADDVPDGLAGNSAYVIKPAAARAAIEKVREVGLWPNDAMLCRQFFDLQELYPFVTRVEQEVSTSS
jgi:GR25 family glycosyltransferase involved in LPS biosynthesis